VAERLDVLQAYEAWNDLAQRCDLPRATILNAKRAASIAARLGECGGIVGWQTALQNIEKSSFLCGDSDRDFKATLDFLLQPSSFVKVLEGAYGNGRHRESKSSKSTAASLGARIKALSERQTIKGEG
jgi:hypothetical protein